jgi:3-hydroxyisobutyrate dehydrogenase-like beta-hydroxyacid dehydrogenase
MGGMDDRRKMTRAAMPGTGIMGSAMTRNLLAAGLPTTVWGARPSGWARLARAAG